MPKTSLQAAIRLSGSPRSPLASPTLLCKERLVPLRALGRSEPYYQKRSRHFFSFWKRSALELSVVDFLLIIAFDLDFLLARFAEA